MKNKILLPIVLIFLVMTSIFYMLRLYDWTNSCEGWITGDWLINYSGGFTRRGLMGFVIVGLSDLIGAKPNFMAMYFQATIYIAFIVVLFFTFYRKRINNWFLIMLLSPLTLLFPICEPNAVGRKEVILFLIFSLYILFLNRKIYKSTVGILLFSAILFVATLCHELTFFFTPYFILAAYLKAKIDNESFSVFKMIYLFAGSFLAILLLFSFGKTINGSIIGAGLLKRGLDKSICEGILSWRNWSIKDNLTFAMECGYLAISGFSTAIFLGLIPFLFFVNKLHSQLVTIKKFVIVFLCLIIFSSPLFLLAEDWGRWINIHFMMLLITATLFLREAPSSYVNENIIFPRLWKTKNLLSKLSNNIVFISVILLYLIGWSVLLNYPIIHFKIFEVTNWVINFIGFHV